MEIFEYRRASDPRSAIEAARTAVTASYIGGGTNLIDYMTLNVVQPRLLVDINHLPETYAQIERDARRLRLGALVRMAQAEEHPVVRSEFPVIAETLSGAASRQIRNMATLGGNVLQRTRCEYFRGSGFACNKRVPGSGCDAINGLNRGHAVLGTSEHCIAAYAGDLAQALIALDAIVETQGGLGGARRIPFAQLHRLPAQDPSRETTLAPHELITHLEVPAGPWTRRSCFVKVRDRESYQFALASAAVALHVEGGVVGEVRIALGGVATVPWRAREAEEILRGQPLDESGAERAAQAAFSGAHPQPLNAFKVLLGQRTLVRALLRAQAMQVAA
jgi:xanthine dehydrogenase YagS FAD-binding subunit